MDQIEKFDVVAAYTASAPDSHIHCRPLWPRRRRPDRRLQPLRRRHRRYWRWWPLIQPRREQRQLRCKDTKYKVKPYAPSLWTLLRGHFIMIYRLRAHLEPFGAAFRYSRIDSFLKPLWLISWTDSKQKVISWVPENSFSGEYLLKKF